MRRRAPPRLLHRPPLRLARQPRPPRSLASPPPLSFRPARRRRLVCRRLHRQRRPGPHPCAPPRVAPPAAVTLRLVRRVQGGDAGLHGSGRDASASGYLFLQTG